MDIFRDIFLSHAGTDKEEYVIPLVRELEKRDISYWLDEAELGWGKSLLKLISEGIERSKFVIVFISDNFLQRPWPEAELRAALSKEISKNELIVLPLFIADSEKILTKHPFLRDKFWITWESGLDKIVEEIEIVLGRKFQSSWEFIHPAEFKGNVWIKILPRIENINCKHQYILSWGRWERKGELIFKTGDSLLLDFKKISEKDTWPIHFQINPPAYVKAGKGNVVIDINKGWNLMDRQGYYKGFISKIIQTFYPDANE